jgi:Recombinase
VTSEAKLAEECVAKGMSARAVARELEARKEPTPNGGAWHAASVLRIMKRLDAADRAVIAQMLLNQHPKPVLWTAHASAHDIE